MARFIEQERVNRVIRTVLEPVRGLVGRERFAAMFEKRLPVVGKINVAIPGGRKLTLYSGRKDEVTGDLYWHGYEGFESESIEVFRRLAIEAETIFDIGANVGIYGLVAAAVNPRAQVWGFEPVRRVSRIYKRNVKKNGLANLTPVRGALGAHTGTIQLYVPMGPTPSGARTTRLRKGRHSKIERVKIWTGDRFMEMHEIKRLDLIKIDTETTEPEVFEGLRATIERDGPVILCEVLWQRTEEALMAFFGPLGYRYYHLTDEGPVEREVIEGDKTYAFRNYLFCRGELPAAARLG